MVPVEDPTGRNSSWKTALLVLSVAVALIIPLAFGLLFGNFRALPPAHHAPAFAWKRSAASFLDRRYFVCGFPVVFIGMHLPSYLKVTLFLPSVQPRADLFAMFGTYRAGTQASACPSMILAFIYFAR